MMLHLLSCAARAALLCGLLAACASAVPVRTTTLLPASGGAAELTFAEDLPVRLSTGYTRSVSRGSLWRVAGVLPEGAVYQPVDTVFAIEGRQVHEAWLVVHEGLLRGFYLPGESRFSPLSPPVSIPPTRGATR